MLCHRITDVGLRFEKTFEFNDTPVPAGEKGTHLAAGLKGPRLD